jgi:formylglycine-generating enzyme required for sulfatase activity
MRNLFLLLFSLVLAAAPVWAQSEPENLVVVPGGTFLNIKSNYYGKTATPALPYLGKNVSVKTFAIGKYEVTQKEWMEVMGSNPSKYKGDNYPVDTVTWYDAVEYCNKRSLKEGLQPYYNIDKGQKDPHNKTQLDDIKWTVIIVPGANGYRLPTEAEWEYAADGGQSSKNYTYSGSDEVDKVAWYFKNSGDTELNGLWSWPSIEHNHNRTKAPGGKAPNELGLYDMSGNVREWCWNWYEDTASNGNGPEEGSAGRVWRGGGWLGGDFCCASSFRAGFEANGKGADQGFRVCRNP